MTRLTLELHPDRRRTSRQSREDWGRSWIQDSDKMLAQIGNQIQRELESRVKEVAAHVHATPEADAVHVSVDAVRSQKPDFASWAAANWASAVAVVDAPLFSEQIRSVAEKVAVWNKFYVVPAKH
jgi:hypothetical protein